MYGYFHSFSFDTLGTISSNGHLQSSVIPRPVARRQFSSPAGTLMPINLSRAAAEISNGPRSCTNPFANDSFIIPENDLESIAISKALTSCPAILTEEQETISKPIKNNPFIPNWIELTTSDLSARNNNIINNSSTAESCPIENPPKTVPIEHKKFRSRSRSEAEIELDDTSTAASIHFTNCRRKMSQQTISDTDSTTVAATTNPFKSPGHLHKTLSETYLVDQLTLSARNYRSLSQQWQFGRALTRQGSNQSLGYSTVGGSANGSQNSIVSTGSVPLLTRAESCESVSSESSVGLADLEMPVAQVTGMLCVGLQYDK